MLTIDSEEGGPGTWKFNNELLLEEDFNTLIKKSINEIKRTYAATPYNPAYIDTTHKNINLTISSALFWETMLVTLRGTIIYYSKRRKKAKNNRMVNLEARIQELNTKVNTGNATNQDFTLLAELNSNLQELRQADLQGAYIRSRANLIEFGEKPSKLFLNLENRNRINKNITAIKVNQTTTIYNQKEIIICIKDFYSNLYKKQQ